MKGLINTALLLTIALLCAVYANAQVTIGENREPKATLEVVAKKGAIPDGVIIPRLTAKELCDLSGNYTADQKGAIVFITDTASIAPLDVSSQCISLSYTFSNGEGYYFFDGQFWRPLEGDDWATSGNTQPSNSLAFTGYYTYFGRWDNMPIQFIYGGKPYFAVGAKLYPVLQGNDFRPSFFDNFTVKDTDATYGSHGNNYNYFLRVENRSVIVGNGYQSAGEDDTEPVDITPFHANSNYVPLILDSYKEDLYPTTSQNGSMYYNSTMQRFRCFENGAWVNCTDGSGSLVIKKVTADYTVTNEDVILCEAASGTLNITLPVTGVAAGKRISIADKGLGCEGVAVSPSSLYNNAGANISAGMTMTYVFVGDGKWLCTGATHSYLTFGL
ncbi:MAG: hypothetical protein LBR64_04825 [Dysgonamonadaceae bacterium]|jgi:hypothetical protein|nr:hypothetical protein [Dysgonamonadaceae bacterium]